MTETPPMKENHALLAAASAGVIPAAWVK